METKTSLSSALLCIIYHVIPHLRILTILKICFLSLHSLNYKLNKISRNENGPRNLSGITSSTVEPIIGMLSIKTIKTMIVITYLNREIFTYYEFGNN